MSPSSVRIAFGFLAVAGFTACGGDGGGTGPTPNSIAVSAGNNQVGAAGTALAESLAVIVRDQAGAPLAGVNVTFTVTAGAGSVSPASSVSSATGIAKTLRTLGPNAGTQTVNATAGGLAPVSFSAVSRINGAVNIANSSIAPFTDTVDAVKAESLVVLVTNESAAPVPGVTVTWATTGGVVSPTSRVTDAAGLSKTRFTYGTGAGSQTATATVTGLVGSPVTITFNAAAGTAVAIAKTAGDGGTASPGTQVTLTVQGRDTHGNARTGVAIDWALGTGGGSITPPSNTTAGVTGSASATRTLGGTSGTQTATATASALPGTPSVTYSTSAVWTVNVADNSFTPSSRTIVAGDSVAWVWANPTVAHNVTFAAVTGAPLGIGDRTTVGSVSRTFATAGTFNYSCTNHNGMNGTVTVTP